MNTHSEHRKSVGRPRTYSERGRRVDIYLPEHQIQWLKKEDNMSKTIQKAINYSDAMLAIAKRNDEIEKEKREMKKQQMKNR